MAIKTQASQLHFQFNSRERELAIKLDECFDVTHGASWDELSFWLAEAKPIAVDRFGLHQEILVVYSSHQKSDARIVKAIHEISRDKRFNDRIDKVVYMVIHNGDHDSLSEVIKGAGDKIIVPIHASELDDSSRGNVFIRSRMAKYIGEVDLFGMSSPLMTDRYFFGRDAIVEALSVRATAQRQNSGLFGLRKTGKTSVLYAIERRKSTDDLVIYIDCQNPSRYTLRWWELLSSIVETAYEKIKQYRSLSLRMADYTEKTAGKLFLHDVKKILDAGYRVILTQFDEIEYITPQLSNKHGSHWDIDYLPFWQTIRSIHQELNGQFVFIVGGVNPSCVEQTHFGSIQNPIFQLAQPFFLEPFKSDDVRQMVKSIGRYAGMTFDESACAYLQNYYGGHPFLIRIACSEMWSVIDNRNPTKRTTISNSTFAYSASRIGNRLANPIKDILLSLVWWYPEEYELLSLLAQGEGDFFQQYLKEDPGSLVQFAKYGLLTPDASGFAIADVQQFLNMHGHLYKQQISPFSRTDMPQDLLPAVPDLETLSDLFSKRAQIEIGLRKIIIQYLSIKYHFDAAELAKGIAGKLRKRAGHKDAISLFVGIESKVAINELYTLDLKDVIVGHWEMFRGLFGWDQNTFSQNMEIVNTARRHEAHTKPISDAEYQAFTSAYSWVLEKLNKVP